MGVLVDDEVEGGDEGLGAGLIEESLFLAEVTRDFTQVRVLVFWDLDILAVHD